MSMLGIAGVAPLLAAEEETGEGRRRQGGRAEKEGQQRAEQEEGQAGSRAVGALC